MQNYLCVRKLEDIKKYLEGAKIVAFDIETSPTEKYRNEEKAALDPYKATITGISFSKKVGTGIYIPINHITGNCENAIEIMEWLKVNIFKSSEVLKIVHNLAFETMFFYALGIQIELPVYDTILASMMTLKTDSEFRVLSDSGLKTLVAQLIKVQMPKFEDVVGKNRTANGCFDELDPTDNDTINYACSDSDYALQLYHIFNGWFDKYLPRHRWIIENIESPVAIFIGIMKYNGVAVDKALMYKKQFEAEQKISEIRSRIHTVIGQNIDIGANAATDELKNYLYKELKLPVLKTTAKFKEGSDEETLILLKEWCEVHQSNHIALIEAIHDYRKWNKLKSTYIDGFIHSVNTASDKIHCSLYQLGTDTGRFSSRYPNLQNMPRQDTDPIGIRNFIVSSENHTFVDFDFNQVELRLGAWYCKDEKMIKTYKNGGDIHAQTTSVIYGIPFKQAINKNSEHYKERRSISKNCNFGVFYGLFANGLMRNLKKAGINKTKAECEEIIANIKKGYPCIDIWQNNEKIRARYIGISTTALGRTRILKGIHSTNWGIRSFWERCALNTPIQGTAADILKLAMVRILNGLKDRPYIKPILTIHDEILFEVENNKIDEAVKFIKECMEIAPFDGLDIPIIADGSIGAKFGELEEII